MNITTVDKQVEKKREAILCDGLEIGWIENAPIGTGEKYHVCLFVSNSYSCLETAKHLLQGYGKTKEEAIKAALENGRTIGQDILQGSYNLETMIFGNQKSN